MMPGKPRKIGPRMTSRIETKRRRARNKRRGKCRCGRTRHKHFKHCRYCLAEQRVVNNRRTYRLSRGLCTRCGLFPGTPWQRSLRCAWCRENKWQEMDPRSFEEFVRENEI